MVGESIKGRKIRQFFTDIFYLVFFWRLSFSLFFPMKRHRSASSSDNDEPASLVPPRPKRVRVESDEKQMEDLRTMIRVTQKTIQFNTELRERSKASLLELESQVYVTVPWTVFEYVTARSTLAWKPLPFDAQLMCMRSGCEDFATQQVSWQYPYKEFTRTAEMCVACLHLVDHCQGVLEQLAPMQVTAADYPSVDRLRTQALKRFDVVVKLADYEPEQAAQLRKGRSKEKH